MTRSDEMRAQFAQLQIPVKTLLLEHYMKLHALLSDALPASGLFKGQYRMEAFSPERMRYLTCAADYFSEREAISFGDRGFIGFAGWASTASCEPIYAAFVRWMEWLNEIGLTNKVENN